MSSDDGRSKGCGLVLYQKPQDAARAIRELQNSELHGRPIFGKLRSFCANTSTSSLRMPEN